MAEPTDEQLKKYADGLPEVYRRVLECFQWDDRRPRRAGSMLLVETLDERLKNFYDSYRVGDTEAALDKLTSRGFLTKVDEPLLCFTPTELGERLITASTGVAPDPEGVPELPELAWA